LLAFQARWEKSVRETWRSFFALGAFCCLQAWKPQTYQKGQPDKRKNEMPVSYVIQHKTARRMNFILTDQVRGTGSGSYEYRRRGPQVTDLARTVFSCLGDAGKRGIFELEAAFELAKVIYPEMMAKAVFEKKTAGGLPPRVLIKE
jgi:hypothetical protein